MEFIIDDSGCNTKEKSVCHHNRNKHVTESKAHISCLPDAIMIHIFSLLPLKALILASLVSKQWESLVKNLFSVIPSSLNLNEIEMATGIIHKSIDLFQSTYSHWPNMYQLCLRYSITIGSKNFTQFVNRALHLHNGCIIKKLCFTLCYDGHPSNQEKVNKWLRFAMVNDIKELELNFSEGTILGYDKLSEAYELPYEPCQSMSLERVILKLCKLGISSLEFFGSLQSIFLKQVKVLDFSIEDLVSKYPMLEDLTLDQCCIPVNFMICKKDIMLKSLTMICCYTEDHPLCPIDISAPKLLMLTLEEYYLTIKTNIKVPKLTDFIIAIYELYADNAQREALVKLLGRSNHCQTLSMNTWCIQVLSYGAYFLQQPSIFFINLKHLKLQVCLRKEELPGIAYIMKNCPFMESLTLDIYESPTILWSGLQGELQFGFDYEEGNYLQSQTSLPFHCLQYSLKEVIVYGISGRSHEMQMLRFLLENAKVLERMYLCIPEEGLGHWILQQLSIYPKASPRAIISI